MSGALAISSGTLAAVVVVVVLDLFALLFGLSFLRARRGRRAAAGPGGAAVPVPAREAERAVGAPRPISRRDFFRRSWLASLTVFGAQFGAASIAFLWPPLRGGFGAVIPAGSVAEIKAQIADTRQPFYSGAGRFYIVAYDGRPTEGVDYERDGLVAQGLMALYQRCVHLGCRVPFCESSQWFECPCHGSKYNTAGEYKLGPAPRGLDRFRVRVEEDQLMVDTSEIVLGPPRGVDTTGRPQAGPFCVAVG